MVFFYYVCLKSKFMAFAELLKSIIDSSKDRIKKPIAGAFFLSFIFYNRAPILYFIFSKSEVEDKLQILATIFKLDFWSYFIPFLMAFFYVLGLPYLSFFLNKILNKQKIDSLVLIYNIKNERAEKEKALQEKIAGNKELQDLNDRIENLQIENQNLKDTINLNDKNHNEVVKKMNSRINDIEKSKNDILKSEALKMGFTESEFLHYKFLSSILNNNDINVLKRVSDRKDNGLNIDKNINDQVKRLLDNDLIDVSDNDKLFMTDYGRNFLSLHRVDSLL